MTKQQPGRSLPTLALSTDQLSLAAYLTSRGFRPMLTASAKGKILFQFAPAVFLSDAIADFHSGNALVDPAAYDAARIELRRQMDALIADAR